MHLTEEELERGVVTNEMSGKRDCCDNRKKKVHSQLYLQKWPSEQVRAKQMLVQLLPCPPPHLTTHTNSALHSHPFI